MPSPRRKPHCTRCNQPMAGHRRPHGTPICPPELPTPPSTPSPDDGGDYSDDDGTDIDTALVTTPVDVKPYTGAYYKSVRTLADVPYPPDGLYHYRNPNWGASTILDASSPSPVEQPAAHYHDDYTPASDRNDSLVPTVLNGPSPARLPHHYHHHHHHHHQQVPAPAHRGRASPAKMDAQSPRRSRMPHDCDSAGCVDSTPGPSRAPSYAHHHDATPFEEPVEEEEEEGGDTPAPVDESISMRMIRAATHSATILRNLVGATVPSAGLYSAPKSALSAAQRAARSRGLHTGVMTKPRREGSSESVSRPQSLEKHESSVWMVVGTEKRAVDHLMDLQLERRVSGQDPTAAPGAVVLKVEPYNLGIPRGLLFTQLVMASLIGGLMVLVALAYV